MTETEADKIDLAVECFKSGLSLADSATRYGLSLTSLEAEVERRAKAKRSESSSSRSEFVYESAQMEDAVNSVLCGMSIKDAAAAYGVSKNALKQALRQEIDKEPVEEGALVVAEEPEAEEANAIFNGADAVPDAVEFNPAAGGNVLVIEPARRQTELKMALKSKEELGDEIAVHCGSFEGTLHRARFLCPGLRSECIELPDGRWVTPKTFSIIGGKASLKNWKNAVRINNVSLRHYMDAGLLDFFEHETNCSGKCSHKSGGSLGKYQSRINSMKMKTAIDLQTQEELTTSGGSTPLQQDRATHNDSGEPPALLPFVENISASPAFTVLRQAQGKDTNSSTTASQPVFPMPTLLPEGKLIKTDVDSEVNVASVAPNVTQQLGGRSVSLIPASITNLSKNMQKARQSQITASLPSHSGNPPQTIIVRPISDAGSKSALAVGQPRPVTYLVPTSTSGSRVQLPPNSVLVPVSTAQAQAPVIQSSSGFPNIENIMKDSSHFWKGILDIGLLELIIHEMKVQLSTLKRRILMQNTVGAADAKALSKVASALWMQESIRQKLAEKKDDMKRQNDRIQSEIDELKRKMEIHERRKQELKRKTDMFDEFMSKRPCVQIESSDEEDAWSTPKAASAEKAVPTPARIESPTPISIVPVADKEGGKVGQKALGHEGSSPYVAKSGRNARKSFVPVKKPATPTNMEELEGNEEAPMDTDTTYGVAENGRPETNGLESATATRSRRKADEREEASTNGVLHEDGAGANSAEERDESDEALTENEEKEIEEEYAGNGEEGTAGFNTNGKENGSVKMKESSKDSMKMVIRMPKGRSKGSPKSVSAGSNSEASDDGS